MFSAFLDTISLSGNYASYNDSNPNELYSRDEITSKTERIFDGITEELNKANEKLDEISANKDREVSRIFAGLKNE